MNELELEAAQSLVERAMEAEEITQADFLMGAAKRLDPMLDTGKFRADWRTLWMGQMEGNRNG